jgi:CelD/BcsL family acetyltransferase involved in cellulose biosynthesis
MSKTSIRVVRESKGFESLLGAWNSVLERSGDDKSVFLTHEWVSTWWKHFGQGAELNIVLVEKDQEVIGIVPLMKTEYGIGPVKLRTLETIGAMDCNYAALVPAENRDEATAALLAYLEEELAKSGLFLRLDHVPEDSGLRDPLRRLAPLFSSSLAIQERAMTLAPYMVLPTTWDDCFHSLGRRRRKSLRREQRRLEERFNVEFQQWAEDTLDERLDRVFDLHQKRWRSVGVRGMFSDPRMKAFYKDIARQFVEKDWLCLSGLTLDGEIASADCGFVYNRKYYGFMMARDVSFSSYSVGHVHTMHVVREAIGRGLREYDFLRGDEPYKFFWTKSARRYLEITLIRKGICTGLYLRYVRAFFRLLEMRQYGLRESYARYRIRKRREAQKSRMRLHKKP